VTARSHGDWRVLQPEDVAALLRGYARRWWIAGGWALDLFLGRQTREHADLDVVVLRDDQEALRAHFRDWELHVAHDGVLEPWDGARLELPRHGLWARRAADAPWELDLLLMETREGEWVYRRDPAIALPLERAGLVRGGIPFLAPELPLLYKSKAPRAHDEDDFAAVLPLLDDVRREWLRGAIASQDPGHPWLPRLG